MFVVLIKKMSEINEIERRTLRRANDVLREATGPRESELLFDEFWREGDLSIMFGAAGVGKSVLAMQIADAIARGRPIDGFRMPTRRRSVLYIDLGLRDEQFRARYSYESDGSKKIRTYSFAKGLYRECPVNPDDICGTIRNAVTNSGVKAVIVDSLTALKQTYQGTTETLELLKRLRQLCEELGVSILVLTDCQDARGASLVSERDLGRSRILCNLADSVFAIGRNPNSRRGAFLIQTRSRSGPVVWTTDNAPLCHIKKFEDGLLGFAFDDRFSPHLDDERRLLICRVHRLKELGCTLAEISELLSISPSMAQRLNKKWTPSMERDEDEEQFGIDAISAERSEEMEDTEEVWESDTFEEEEWTAPGDTEPSWANDEEEALENIAQEPEKAPSEETPGRLSVYSLEHDVDRYGNQIYIQKRGEKSGRIELFYRFDEKRRLLRYTRTIFGWGVDPVETSPYLDSG
jgi:hypothetical protein